VAVLFDGSAAADLRTRCGPKIVSATAGLAGAAVFRAIARARVVARRARRRSARARIRVCRRDTAHITGTAGRRTARDAGCNVRADLFARRIAAGPRVSAATGTRALLLRIRVGRACTKSAIAFPHAISERIDARCTGSHASEALSAGEAILARFALATRKAAIAATADARTARARIARTRHRGIGRRIAAQQQRCIGIVFTDLVPGLAREQCEQECESDNGRHHAISGRTCVQL
jgi:hypothetical protein